MPGFLSVRPQDWATPQAVATAGGPLAVGTEAHGIHIRADGGGWSQPSSGIGSTAFVPRVCGTNGSATRIYAVYADTFGSTGLKFATSNDGGATFTDMTIPADAVGGVNLNFSHHIHSPADGTVYLAAGGDGSDNGIYKTTDHGATWSRIVTFPAGTIRAGSVFATATRLWYARFVQGAGAASSCYYSALDGTGETAIPTIQSSAANQPPQMIAAADDTVVIISLPGSTGLYSWTVGAGSATAINETGGNTPLGIAAPTASILTALDYAPNPSAIWRSTDAGSSWTDVHDYSATESGLSGGDDAFGRKMDWVKTDAQKVFCIGSKNRDSNAQMYMLISTDQGATWSVDDVTTLPSDGSGVFVWDIGALG